MVYSPRVSARLVLSCAVLAVAVAPSLVGPRPIAAQTDTPPTPLRPAMIRQAPLLFELNGGQTAQEVQFLSRGRGYTLFLNATEAVLKLSAPGSASKPRAHVAYGRDDQPALVPDTAVRMRLENARPARGEGLAPSNATVNYIIGNDSKQWRTGVSTFRKIRFPEVYPGIDILYYGNDGRLEYDFVVAAGANPGAIRLGFDGVSNIAIGAEGELEVHVDQQRLTFQKPFAYQELPSGRRPVDARYVLRAGNTAVFEVADYDESRTLVIDPVLIYSTYHGGSSSDSGSDIAVGADGSVYITGTTSSADFPVEPSPLRCFRGDCPFQENLAGGSDVFVSKFDASGALAYSTYLGGSLNDQGNAIGIDSAGNAYITGSTSSTNFPIAPSPCGGASPPCPFRSTNAGADDAFVTKLNAAGSSLVYSTYLGGSSGDRAFDLDVINNGTAVVVVGETFSGNFPTASPFQATNRGGYDAFITWISADGSFSLFSSYLGGSGVDYASGVDAGNGYRIVGSTTSSDFPVVGGSIVQPTHGGFFDGFVSTIVANELFASTYFGGSSTDHVHDVFINGADTYIVGETLSPNLHVLRALQPIHGGSRDAFVARLGGGLSLYFSTYFGGSGGEEAYGVTLDNFGAVVFVGRTTSADLPLSQAFQESYGGSFDAFVASIPSGGLTLRYASYLGGIGQDHARAIVSGPYPDPHVYVTGYTESTNFPTRNPEQPNRAGGFDAFYTKLSRNAPPLANAGADQTVETDTPSSTVITLDGSTSTDPDGDALTYEWRNSGGTVVGNTATVNLALPLGTHTFSLMVSDGGGGTDSDSVVVSLAIDTTPPSVALLAPNGGEKLFSGTPYTISFMAADAVGIAGHDLELSSDGGATFSNIPECTNLPATARSCAWISPSPVTATARVRLITQDTSGNVASDTSAANFNIVTGTASLTLTSPKTSADWGIGSNQQIKWSHSLGVNSYVRIEKSSDGGETWSTLEASFKNTGAASSVYNWKVTGVATMEARIRVSWTAAPQVADASGGNFIISPVYIVVGQPATTITNYGYGTSRKQTWTTNLGPQDRVELWLSTDGGATFSTLLGSAVATTKNVAYTVPTLSQATTSARLQARWVASPDVYGTTPVDFTVAPPFVKVVHPNGPADVWTVGSSRTVEWIDNLGSLEDVRIDLSVDGGGSYSRVVLANTPSDGRQGVTVSSSWLSSMAAIKITWLKNGAVSDSSNQNFRIQ